MDLGTGVPPKIDMTKAEREKKPQSGKHALRNAILSIVFVIFCCVGALMIWAYPHPEVQSNATASEQARVQLLDMYTLFAGDTDPGYKTGAILREVQVNALLKRLQNLYREKDVDRGYFDRYPVNATVDIEAEVMWVTITALGAV